MSREEIKAGIPLRNAAFLKLQFKAHLSGAGFKYLGSHQEYEFHQFITCQI